MNKGWNEVSHRLYFLFGVSALLALLALLVLAIYKEIPWTSLVNAALVMGFLVLIFGQIVQVHLLEEIAAAAHS